MPTPFTHIIYAQRLLTDSALPQTVRELLQAQRPAFWLGSIAADGHGLEGLKREDTHFYSYERPIEIAPARVMLDRYPQMKPSADDAARTAFVAGYIAHLALDEVWTRDMLAPHFAVGTWGTRATRFLMLHILLIMMDERDEARLHPGIADELGAAQPDGWSPFLSDGALCEWREAIHSQLIPGGTSQTMAIIAPRVQKTEAELRTILDSSDVMREQLWAYILPELLAAIEDSMYITARDQMLAYLGET